MPKASQIDVEIVRECLATLGVSTEVAALSAAVTALQAADLAFDTRADAAEAAVTALQAADSDFSDRIAEVEDLVGALPVANIPFAWVVFDGTAMPDPEILNGQFALNVERQSAGVYRFTFPDFGDTTFGALFSAADSPVVEVARTSSSIDVETTEGEVSAFTTIALFGTVPEPS